MEEGYGDLLTAHCTGQLGLAGAVLDVGTVLPAWLRTHYAPWQGNRWRRTMNRLARRQVGHRRHRIIAKSRMAIRLRTTSSVGVAVRKRRCPLISGNGSGRIRAQPSSARTKGLRRGVYIPVHWCRFGQSRRYAHVAIVLHRRGLTIGAVR